MSKNGKFNRRAWETSLGEVRQGAIKFVEAMANVMEATVDASDPMAVAKNMIYMGYAVGVIAGKWDKGGDLHTSEEGYYTKEGGEK